MNSRLKKMMFCALFTAICAVFSQIYIPLPSLVPINLATAAVFMAGVLLGPRYGTASMAVYVVLGAVGVPVFAGLNGGIVYLAGPTGGFIIGYAAAAFVIGLAAKNKDSYLVLCGAMALGMLTYFVLGTSWFMISTSSPLGTALMACVLPFIPGDLLKIALAAMLCRRLKKVVE